MADIVDRLRNGITDGSHLRWAVTPVHIEAAEEIERLRASSRDNQMLAYKWQEAHDCLKAGLPYSFPKPTDLPESLAELATLRASIDKLEKAITALRPPERASDCWCWYSHDIERCGHQIQCVNARAALDQDKGGK